MIDSIDIENALARIKKHILPTPVAVSPSLSHICGVPVYLKHEHHQTTGSFKLRGAFNAILQLSPEERDRGVVTVSTGNHGRALSYAAKHCGVKATICMSNLVPENKVTEIQRLGAEVRIVGKSQDEAQKEVDRLIETEGLCLVHPFDDPAVIAGQGTIGIEIIDTLPDVGTILLGVSGGGLASGVARAIKSRRPQTRVVGLTMARGAAMKASLAAGHPVEVEELETFADALGGGIGLDNKWTFAMCRDLLDDVILLSEPDIAVGIQHAYAQEREVVEGAGAVGIAALLAKKVNDLRGPVVTILSGRNIDMDLHRRIVSTEIAAF